MVVVYQLTSIKVSEKTALEVILTTLHAGGKFSEKNYKISGGLHGVGASVVNALSLEFVVEVIRNKKVYKQKYEKGLAQGKLELISETNKISGTSITFSPDPEIFGEDTSFLPSYLFSIIQNKAYLSPGVKIHWKCNEEVLKIQKDTQTPREKILLFEEGIKQLLLDKVKDKALLVSSIFFEKVLVKDEKIECAIVWFDNKDLNFITSFCNTVNTSNGGSHEQGFKIGLTKAIKNFAQISGFKKSNDITIEDIIKNIGSIISIFIKNPQFQGQTKKN